MTPGVSEPVATARRISVLVVDDDPDIRDTVAEVLRDEGYSVEAASQGAEALEALQHFRPSLILLDLNMPVMSGDEFRKIQRSDPRLSEIPVVVMTAADRMADRLAEVAPDEALAKPVTLARLLSVVSRFASIDGPGDREPGQ